MDVRAIAPPELMSGRNGPAVVVAKPHVESKPVDLEQQLREVKALVKQAAPQVQHSVDISVNEASGCFVIRVINEQTGEVVSEVPSERVLEALAQMLKGSGLMLDRSA
jgi:uncharacterized FlaG/YvyC family protein